MNWHPILFSGWKLRRILEWDFAPQGDMQTRRVIKPQPSVPARFEWREDHPGLWRPYDDLGNWLPCYGQWRCPYGVAGDNLWVREAHYRWTGCGDAPRAWVQAPDGDRYSARGYIGEGENDALYGEAAACYKVRSIHMPRWASRLAFGVTAIGVEALQDITPDEIVAEGAWNPAHSVDEDCSQAYEAWADVWNGLHAAPKPAKRNPYTHVPEKCYVSYPWDRVRETRERAGKAWYVVGDPMVWRVRFNRDD